MRSKKSYTDSAIMLNELYLKHQNKPFNFKNVTHIVTNSTRTFKFYDLVTLGYIIKIKPGKFSVSLKERNLSKVATELQVLAGNRLHIKSQKEDLFSQSIDGLPAHLSQAIIEFKSLGYKIFKPTFEEI